MSIDNAVKFFSCFLDGRSYLGKCIELTPPKLTMKTDEYLTGGMTAPIKDPLYILEALEASWQFMGQETEALAKFGITEGGMGVSLVFKTSMQKADGKGTVPATYTMRGMISELDSGTIKGGERPNLNCKMELTYYKLEHGGRVLHEVEPEKMVLIVDGKDLLAEHRKNIGA